MIAMLLVISSAAPLITALADDEVTDGNAASEEIVITISSEKEFTAFLKKCALDTWSQDKTAVLEKDLNLKGKKFTPAATFGGVFDGGGHTIKGVKIKSDGSNSGLFRYVQPGGVIKNLTVEGSAELTGTKTNVALVAGNNSGTILGCEVRGSVKGGTGVGAVAGVNQTTGIINGCKSHAKVYGEHYAGGIAGRNFGQIMMCTNSGDVNTYTEEVKLDIENINLEKIRSAENTTDITDVGGVAGYSSGVLQDCTNSGRVGYEHVGYNIGGIVGRQCGYVSSCTNSGKVYGRKDVGGICGQMEPYTVLEYNLSSFDRVSDALDSLQSSVDAAIADFRGSKTTIKNRLDSIRGYVDDARTDTDSLLDKSKELMNSGIDSANDLSARLSGTLSSIAPVFDTMAKQADSIASLADGYKKEFDKISDAADTIKTDELDSALDELKAACKELSEASSYLERGLTSAASSVGDMGALKNALHKIAIGISKINKALTRTDESLARIRNAVTDFFGSVKNPDSSIAEEFKKMSDTISESISSIKNSNDLFREGLDKLGNGFDRLPDAINKLSLSGLSSGLDDCARAAGYMKDAMDSITKSVDHIKNAADSASDASDEIKDAMDSIRDVTDKIKDCGDVIIDSLGQMSDIFSDFASKPLITLPQIDDDFTARKDKLSDTIGKITDSLGGLSDDVDGSAGSMAKNLQDMSDKMFRVTDELTGIYDDNKDKTAEDLTEDISDSDADDKSNGKTVRSINRGKVHGDLNVGGIVGAMAIEFDFDPEDDVSKRGDKSLNFVYKTKAVVRECTNRGSVSAKKNCVGAICGKEDLGSIIDSLACGRAESSSGNYVGGIAGLSESTIKNCYSKSIVSGENYIGGIVGRGNNVFNCLSVAYIESANEYRGAIAGDIKKEYTANYFTSDKEHGVDSVSYSGKAEPLSYEAMIALPNVPQEFMSFTATFYVDDKVYKEVEFAYGESLNDKEIPNVPSRDKLFGKWDRTKFNRLTHDVEANAEYYDYVTAIESSRKRGKTTPVLLIEGRFGTNPKMTVENEKNHAPGKGLQRREAERLHVTLSENDASVVTVHYAPPKKVKNPKIYVLSGSEWRRVKTSADGSYIVFKVKGNDFSFSVVKRSVIAKIAIAAAVIAAAAAAAALAYAAVRRELEKRGSK